MGPILTESLLQDAAMSEPRQLGLNLLGGGSSSHESRDLASLTEGLLQDSVSLESREMGLGLILDLPDDLAQHQIIGGMLSLEDVMQLDFACCNTDFRPKLLACLKEVDASFVHRERFKDLKTLEWSVSRDLAGVRKEHARGCTFEMEGVSTPSNLWFAAAARKAPLAMEMVLRMDVGIHADHSDPTGRTVLHNATLFNQQDMIKFCVSHLGCSLDVEDDYGDTPLHLCARFGRHKAAESLLKTGASVNAVNYQGNTPLHYASFEGHARIVRLLMDSKDADTVDINATNLVGDTPLLRACALGQGDVVSCLLDEYGAEVNVKNHLNVSPLHVAVHGGHTEISELLLKAGANPNSPGRRGPLHTPLQSAVLHKQNDIAWLMAVDYGADTTLVVPRRRPTTAH